MNKILDERVVDFLRNKLLEELSKHKLFQNPEIYGKIIYGKPRVIGDTLQEVIGELLPKCFPLGLIDEFKSNFTRRALEDVAFYDTDGNYYAIDIKTHNLSTKFNMPNLTSVERIAKFYGDGDEKKYFVILLVKYTIEKGHLSFTDITFLPIECLDWSCLTIGALGWGQIQIANSNKIKVNRNNTRVDWMLSLCDRLDAFYPKQIQKINKRMDHFRPIRHFWESKK